MAPSVPFMCLKTIIPGFSSCNRPSTLGAHKAFLRPSLTSSDVTDVKCTVCSFLFLYAQSINDDGSVVVQPDWALVCTENKEMQVQPTDIADMPDGYDQTGPEFHSPKNFVHVHPFQKDDKVVHNKLGECTVIQGYVKSMGSVQKFV